MLVFSGSILLCYNANDQKKRQKKEKGENGYETKKEGIRSNLPAGDCADCRISIRVRR